MEVKTVDAQVVTSTSEHFFWVEGKGWTPVRELALGDVLATAEGSAAVSRVEPTGGPATVYNFHVDGLQNYHVGCEQEWARVHNICFREKVGIGITHMEDRIKEGAVNHIVGGMDPRTDAGADALEQYLMGFEGRHPSYVDAQTGAKIHIDRTFHDPAAVIESTTSVHAFHIPEEKLKNRIGDKWIEP